MSGTNGSTGPGSGAEIEAEAEAERIRVFESLRRVPVLAQLSDNDINVLADRAQLRRVAKGEQLIEAGDTARVLFVALSGKFVVQRNGKTIAEILAGEPIGELAFFAGTKRSADVFAVRDAQVLAFDRQVYDELALQLPDLADHILATIAQRMSDAVAHAVPLPPRASHTIAIMPASDEPLPARFTEALRSATASQPETLVVTAADVDIATGETTLQQRLHEWEHDNELVLLICEPGDRLADGSDWFEFVNRNSDTFALVVDMDGPPSARELGAHEQAILKHRDRCTFHLVLWHAETGEPKRESAHWVNGRTPKLLHHIHGDDEGSIHRFLRFLTGEAVGVVLCGGGALGTAHLGTMKALFEAGYEFDAWGGTSVGAAMAAALSSGMPVDEIMDLCDDMFLKSKAMSSIAVPLYGLLNHHAMDREMVKQYGGWDIEDLPVNYFAVSTSLTTNDLHVHRSGELWRAIRASSSLPGILPPVIMDDGEVLIDGALIDNVPVSVMRTMKAGPNIILNFRDQIGWKVRAPYDDMPGRLRTVWNVLTRRRAQRRYPSIAKVMSRAMVVTARRRQQELDLGDDILINVPTMPRMGILDWKKGRQQYELAYRTMKEWLTKAGIDASSTREERFAALRRMSDGSDERSVRPLPNEFVLSTGSQTDGPPAPPNVEATETRTSA